MARIKPGIPVVSELTEGETEYRSVSGQGLISYTKHDNRIYSSKMNQTVIPPVVDKRESSQITNTVINMGPTGELELDLSSLTAASIANGDSIIFLDATSSSAARRESIADVATLFAGAGMTATSSVLNVIGGTGITANANEITTTDGDIVHDNLSGFVADEHIAHGDVTLTAGTGLSGGGTIAANRTFAIDISEYSDVTPADGDKLLCLDSDGANEQLTTVASLATLFAGDGLQAANSVMAVDVSDFVGDGLQDLGSENIGVDVSDFAGTGLEDDGSENLDVSAAQTSITSIINSSLGKIGTVADQEYITFGTSDEINTFINDTERLSVTATGVDVTGAMTVSTSVDITGSAGLILENDKTITNSVAAIIALSGNLTIPDAGTIGSASDTDAMSITSAGLVNISQTATVGTSTAAGNMSDLLSGAQESALADALAADNNTFDFATGTTNLVVSNGFTASNATFVNSGGIGLLTNDSTASGYVSLPITTVDTKIYEVIFDVTDASNSEVEICLSTSTSWNTGAQSGARGTGTSHALIDNYTANDTSSFLIIRLISTTSGHHANLDNIIVREARIWSGAEIGSPSFTSGFAGSGWKIDKDATATNEFDLTVDNMFVRGTLSIYELLIQQIRATNGAIFVSSAAKVASTSSLAAGDSAGTITFEDPSGNSICPFAADDIIMMQRVVPGALVAQDAAASTSTNVTEVIKKLVYEVNGVSGATITTRATTGFTNTSFPSKGDDFVRIGNTGTASRQGLLYLTSDDSNAPFMDVKADIDSYADWHDEGKTKVRVGKLSGITDASLNGGSALSGFGLYGGNVYLLGDITATTGYIGGTRGWVIGTGLLYSLASGTPASSPADGIVMTSGDESNIAVYENTEKRIELGFLGASGAADHFGIKGYKNDGTTAIFELSDDATQIAGWNFTNNSLYKTATTTIGITTAGHSDSPAGANAQFFAGASGGNASLGGNATIAFAKNGRIYGNGIYVKNDIEYLITASRIFGNGSDGDLVLDSDTQTEDENDDGEDLGANWVASGVIQRDLYAANLTIESGVEINTGGYRIFVRGVLTIGGSGCRLYNNGVAGDNGSNGSGSDEGGGNGGSGAGAGGGAGSLVGGVAGGNGGSGGDGGNSHNDNGHNGLTGAAGGTTGNCVSAYSNNAGGRGADGTGSGGGTGGESANAAAGSGTSGEISITNADLSYVIGMRDFFTIDGTLPSLAPAAGASGGGGGGGGDRISGSDGHGGGGGGQGGGSGGHVMVVAKFISGTNSNLELEAKGGNGGNGGNQGSVGGTGTGGIGAGGNGGDGGCITLITGTDPDGIVIDAGGGTKGSQGTTGGTANDTAASNGEDGTTLIIHV